MLELLLENLIKKGSNSLLLLTFSGITLATSGVAGVKLYNEIKNPETPQFSELPTEDQVLGISTQVNDSLAIDDDTDTPINEDIQANTNVTSNNQDVSVDDDFPVSDLNISTKSNVTDSTTTGGCIIQIFGKNYDIAPFRSKHPGGDVFKCGTDMSNAYKSAHGTNVSGLAIYETTASLASSDPTQINTQSKSSISSFEDEEEKEDEEYQEEELHFEDKEDHHEHEDD